MAVHIILRHGLEAHRTSIVPQLGEPIYTTDEHKLYVGDSTTPGGVPLRADAGTLGGVPATISSTPNNGDLLQYNASTGEWEFVSVSSVGCSTLNCLSDVDTSGASNGQVLTFNGTEWVPSTITSGIDNPSTSMLSYFFGLL